MSPPKSSPAVTPVSTPGSQPTSEIRVKRKYTKRAHVLTPARSASTATSNPDELLPTKVTSSRPLPVTSEAQPEIMSVKQYQSIADSAILAASLQRSRMQWLCDGVFKKFWTKPVRRKGILEQPPNNPDTKSMQKLGNATIIVEPHTFDVTFYVVREIQMPSTSTYKYPIQPSYKPSPAAPAAAQPLPQPVVQPNNLSDESKGSAPSPPAQDPAAPTQPETKVPSPATVQNPTPVSAPASTPARLRPPTPPGSSTKTTDPVIQMLASRAATDNNLKELMKVVATSRATPEQLKEFQAHIDEINGIVKKQNMEQVSVKKKPIKTPVSTPIPRPAVAAHPATYNGVHRNSPLGPGPGTGAAQSPQFNTYPVQPRPEAIIKHVVMEFISPVTDQPMSPDRWLFPENAVLDLVYGGTDMTCSFFVERKGSEVLASMRDLTSEEMSNMNNKWQAETEYFQPVTMQVKATQHRTIETIARSAKALPDVLKYMQEVMEKKNRAPKEFLIHRLPKEKMDDFTDSAVELSAEDDDEIKDLYPM